MADRLELHEEFCTILGSRNVYFQPPTTVMMSYDAIRYKLSGKDIKRANDKIYLMVNQYEGIFITSDPDSKVPDVILNHFPMCSFGKPYTSDNLNHYPFTLYY